MKIALALLDICQQISNQKELTRVQLKELNSSGFGKAILARWCVQNKKYAYAARTFLNAYELTELSCLKFEAACALLMQSKERYDDMFTVLNHNSKFLLQQSNEKANKLILEAANEGHVQAAACALYIYLNSGRTVEINRNILFLGLWAASEGFMEGVKFPQRSLLFSLMPDSSVIKMIDKDTYLEICRILYVMACDKLVELASYEMDVLVSSFELSPLLALSGVELDKGNKIVEKMFKVFCIPESSD